MSGSLSNYQSRQEYVLKYTTVAGVDGFDGTRKHQKAVVKAIV
jgi:thioredoxin reductase (NADPH)